MPEKDTKYIFPSNMRYKTHGTLENEQEMLSNIRRHLTEDPKHMNAGCALIRLPIFVFTAGLCLFGVVGAAPTIASMIAQNQFNIFIMLGWFACLIGVCVSLYWSWMCIKSIVYGPPDFDALARSCYQRLITHGREVDTDVFQLTSTWGNTDLFFKINDKTFVYITKDGSVKSGDSMKALCVDGICVLL